MARQTILVALLLTVVCVAVNAYVKPHHFKQMKVAIKGIMTLDCPKGDTSCDFPLQQVENVAEETTGGQNSIVCEHAKLTLQCEDHSKAIKIISANYGRTEPGVIVCPHTTIDTTTCISATSHHMVAQTCNGRRTCELLASNSVFGDPCVGTVKYLKVQFQCV